MYLIPSSSLTCCDLAGFTNRVSHRDSKVGVDIPISALLQEAARFKDLAWADSTKKSLSSSQKAYLDFCSIYELDPMPAEPSHLTLYAVWLVISGRLKSVPSIKNYLSSVRTLHRMHGLDCPTPMSCPDLQYTLRGIARKLARPTKRMDPITPELMHHLLTFPALDPLTAPPVHVVTLDVIRLAYRVLFYSMARISNLVPNSSTSFNPRQQLTWDRVILHPGGVVLKMDLTKTIQSAARCHEIALAESIGSQYCPVAALKRMASIRGECNALSPVFEIPNQHGASGWIPLTRYHMDMVLTRQIMAAGLDVSRYKFHSFRRGAIQMAIRLEPRLQLIRLQSDHSSSAFDCYTALPASKRFDLTSLMVAGMNALGATSSSL